MVGNDVRIGVPITGQGVVDATLSGLASNGTVGWLTWFDRRTGYAGGAWGVRFDQNLNLLDAVPVPLPAAFSGGTLTAIDDYFVHVSTQYVPPLSYQVEARRLDATGLLDSAPLVLGTVPFLTPPKAAGIDGGFVVVWRSAAATSAGLISSNGTVLASNLSMGAQSVGSVFSTPTGAWAIWQANGGGNSVLASPVTNAGARQVPTGLTLYTFSSGASPSFAAQSSGVGTFDVCLAVRDGGTGDIELHRYDLGGTQTASWAARDMPGVSPVTPQTEVVRWGTGETLCSYRAFAGGALSRVLTRFDATGPFDAGEFLWPENQGGSLLANHGSEVVLATLDPAGASPMWSLLPARGPRADGGTRWLRLAAGENPVDMALGRRGAMIVTSEQRIDGFFTRAYVVGVDDGASNPPEGIQLGPGSGYRTSSVAATASGFAVTYADNLDGGSVVGAHLLDESGALVSTVSTNAFTGYTQMQNVALEDGGFSVIAAETSADASVRLYEQTFSSTGVPASPSLLGLLPADSHARVLGFAAQRFGGRLYVAANFSKWDDLTCNLMGRVVGGANDDGGLQLLHHFTNECDETVNELVDDGGWAIGWSDEDHLSLITLATLEGQVVTTQVLRQSDGGFADLSGAAITRTDDGGYIGYASARYTGGISQLEFSDSTSLSNAVVTAFSTRGAAAPIIRSVPGGFVMAYDDFDDREGVQNMRTRFRTYRTRAPVAPVVTSPLDGSTVPSPVTVATIGEPYVQVIVMMDGADYGLQRVDGAGLSSGPFALAPGAHQVFAIAVDAAGQRSSPSPTVHFTVGVPDGGIDGGSDAGSIDPTDAGPDGDAGTSSSRHLTVGCGCGAEPGLAAIGGLLLIVLRRRRSV